METFLTEIHPNSVYVNLATSPQRLEYDVRFWYSTNIDR